MLDRAQVQTADTAEVAGIDGVQRQAVGDRDGGDESVKGASPSFASHGAQIGRDGGEGTGRRLVERQGLEVRFGLLQVSLPGGAVGRIVGDERSRLTARQG